MTNSLLVLGGNGFVGQAVVREAIRRGWSVVSLSRSGTAGPPGVISELGDATKRAVYEPVLNKYGIDAVVDSIGILYESGGRTYEQMNRDQAVVAAEEAKRCATVRTFAYISATEIPGSRMLMPRYFQAKREAETFIEDAGFNRAVIVRPGLVYGVGRLPTVGVAAFYNLMTFLARPLFPKALHVDRVASKLMDAIEDPDGQRRLIHLGVAEMS